MIANTEPTVNTESTWWQETRRKMKRWSKDYRKAFPLAKRTIRFEHKLNHRVEVLFNMIYNPALTHGNIYISTLSKLKKRFLHFCGIKSLTNKTFKSYLSTLEACKLVKMTLKRGVYTMIVKPGLRYVGSMIRGFFRKWRQTFPLNSPFSVYTPYIYLNKDRNPSISMDRSPEQLSYTDGFMVSIQEETGKMYEKFEKDNYWPDSRRKASINEYRKEKGMEPIPEGMPLRPPTERQERSKYDANANRPVVPMWSPAPPKEVTPEIMAYGISKMDEIRRKLGMGVYHA